jgi:hypothetical protein
VLAATVLSVVTLASAAPEELRLVERPDRLLLQRRDEVLWQSERRPMGGTPNYVQSTALGRRAVAFSLAEDGLFVASLSGRERHVADGEHALAWTRAGLLTYRPRETGSTILLRDERGARLRAVARNVRDFRREGDTLFYVTTDARLLRARAGGSVLLADLRSLGFRRPPSLEFVGGLLAVVSQDSRSLLVLDRAGRVFGASSLPRWPVAYVRAGERLAYVTTRWKEDYSTGWDTVWLLRAGETAATALYTREHHETGCGRLVKLAWPAGRLIYISRGFKAEIAAG